MACNDILDIHLFSCVPFGLVPAPLVPGTGVGGLAGVVDPGAGGSRSGRVPPEPSVGVSALPATNLNLFWGWKLVPLFPVLFLFLA